MSVLCRLDCEPAPALGGRLGQDPDAAELWDDVEHEGSISRRPDSDSSSREEPPQLRRHRGEADEGDPEFSSLTQKEATERRS